MQVLPIDSQRQAILGSLRRDGAVVIEAEPGAGKTTRVPRWLLDEVEGEILVLEPRRLAARLAATYVAESLGERVGGRVGYRVRFEEEVSERTRLVFLTDALLVRRLLDDPELRGVGAVVFDEFHERRLAMDLGLALCQRLRRRRPELRLVVMSATLDGQAVASHLGCRLEKAEGRHYPVEMVHSEERDERPLAQRVAGAARRALSEVPEGDVLVFLPGMSEIRRALESCKPIAERHDLLMVPLHGELSREEQDRAVRPARQRKLILATNVAETSVTIEGVRVVIDSGLAHVASHDPWSGLPRLRLKSVSRASAVQRAGRAGRTAPGTAYRLYSRHDFEARPAFDAPEICRSDLAELVLTLATLEATDLSWLDYPPEEALAAARRLLALLGALGEDGAITPLGRELVRLPVHPRLARVAVAAARRGHRQAGCAVAALLGERDVRVERGPARTRGDSDVTHVLDLFEEARRARFSNDALRRAGLHGQGVRAVDKAAAQLERALRQVGGERTAERDEVVRHAVLMGFPDRVAALVPSKASQMPELLLAGGGRARLSDTSVVHDAGFVVAVDAEEGTGGGATRLPLVRLASRVEPEWLLELGVEEVQELSWNDKQGRVEELTQLRYGGLVLDESRNLDVDPARAAPALLEAARRRGLAAFVDPEALAQLSVRLEVLRTVWPEAPVLDEASVWEVLGEVSAESRSLRDLEAAGALDLIRARLPREALSRLEREVPERLRLPGGRELKINYEKGKPPWAESFLQDFFGLAVGPRLCGGKLPVTLHLLAPNRRAVQVTTDLEGFWQRHYPELQRALSRRYPKHAWPDDPRHATPPAPRPRRS